VSKNSEEARTVINRNIYDRKAHSRICGIPHFDENFGKSRMVEFTTKTQRHNKAARATIGGG